MEGLLHGLRPGKGQSSIEFSLAFIVALLFLVFTCRVFVWFGGNLFRRQAAYEDSRLEAGRPKDTGWWFWKQPGTPGKTDFYKKPEFKIFEKDMFKEKDM